MFFTHGETYIYIYRDALYPSPLALGENAKALARLRVASRRNNSICISLKTLMWLTVPMSARDKIIRIAKRQCHIISSHFDCCFIHRFNFAFREASFENARLSSRECEHRGDETRFNRQKLRIASYFLFHGFLFSHKKKKKT